MKLLSNLKKAHKLSYQVLHPGNKKQSVPLALAIFHETTTAAFESYFPEREDASKFLKMINTWWLICNPLGNAVRVGDDKTDFLEALVLKNGMMIVQPLRSHQRRHMRWYWHFVLKVD